MIDLQVYCRSCGEQRDTFRTNGREVKYTNGSCSDCGSTRTAIEVLPR